MLQDDLRRLQRLGIDIWVSPEQARELIDSGQANPLLETDKSRSAHTSGTRPTPTRSRVLRRPRETTKQIKVKEEENRTRPRGEVARDQRGNLGKPKTEMRFEVHMRVYLYGSSAMIIEYSSQCSDAMAKDILRALSGFKEHQLNELHFKFPIVGLMKNESTVATIAGAQEGFQAWFEHRAQNCESMVVIGSAIRDTTARLSTKITRTIYIDELPLSRTGKQKLWNQIKNLNV